MKQFICLLRGGDAQYKKFTKQQNQEHMAHWGTFMGTFMGTFGNKYLGGAPLATTGRTVKDWGKETKSAPYGAGSPVNGYMVINAADYKEAVKMVKTCPIFEIGGSVEVREVVHM
jgi:hypothetical protein